MSNALVIKVTSSICNTVRNEPMKLRELNDYMKRARVSVKFFGDKVTITYLRARTFKVPHFDTTDKMIEWTKQKAQQVVLMPAPFNF